MFPMSTSKHKTSNPCPSLLITGLFYSWLKKLHSPSRFLYLILIAKRISLSRLSDRLVAPEYYKVGQEPLIKGTGLTQAFKILAAFPESCQTPDTYERCLKQGSFSNIQSLPRKDQSNPCFIKLSTTARHFYTHLLWNIDFVKTDPNGLVFHNFMRLEEAVTVTQTRIPRSKTPFPYTAAVMVSICFSIRALERILLQLQLYRYNTFLAECPIMAKAKSCKDQRIPKKPCQLLNDKYCSPSSYYSVGQRHVSLKYLQVDGLYFKLVWSSLWRILAVMLGCMCCSPTITIVQVSTDRFHSFETKISPWSLAQRL